MVDRFAAFRFLAKGRWQPVGVMAERVASSRRIVPEVETAIEAAWKEALARPGVQLFDGPVCRMESFEADAGALRILLSETSYRINVGTNFCNPHFADQFGTDVMANSIGVSTGLITSDGYLILGRRNDTVAYYPDRLHPFAGSVEVRQRVELFDDALRELREEIDLQRDDINTIECIGIAEDLSLRHPELLFVAETTRARKSIEATIDPVEHGTSESFHCDRATLSVAIERQDVTPIGKAVIHRIIELLPALPADA